MNYMLLIYTEEPPYDGELSDVKPSCGGLVPRLQERGQYVASGILKPTGTATSLRIREGRRLVTDGPFAETREGLAGYLLVEAENLDEALKIAAEHPAATFGTVEIRPLLFSEDWPENGTPEKASVIPEGAFTITRTLAAPRELVWRAWTGADQLGQWWGPKGLGTEVHAFDLRSGGTFHYAMVPPEGEKTYGKFTYREIRPTEKLVFTNGFANEAGEYIVAPFGFAWPLEMLTIVTFEEQNGGTLLSLTSYPLSATDEESAQFAAMHDSMVQGFGGTFERLEELLAKEAVAR